MSSSSFYAPALWDRVRDEYLCGETAADVCRRHGVSRSQFYAQARAGGWRRADQASAEAYAPPPEGPPASTPELAAQALARAGDALERGRLAEARGWARLAADLRQLAMGEVGADTWAQALRRHAARATAAPAASPTPAPVTPPAGLRHRAPDSRPAAPSVVNCDAGSAISTGPDSPASPVAPPSPAPATAAERPPAPLDRLSEAELQALCAELDALVREGPHSAEGGDASGAAAEGARSIDPAPLDRRSP